MLALNLYPNVTPKAPAIDKFHYEYCPLFLCYVLMLVELKGKQN